MAQTWTAAQRAVHSVKIKAALQRKKDPRAPIVCKSKSVYDLIRHLLSLLKPRDKLLPSVWNERHRILPKKSAAKTGVFRCFPFQVGPMNAPADPECSSLTIDFASQVLGKTTIIEGIIGWYIDQDPSSMLFIHPTETGAEYWSKNRLRPLIENCPVLTELIDAKPVPQDLPLRRWRQYHLPYPLPLRLAYPLRFQQRSHAESPHGQSHDF